MMEPKVTKKRQKPKLKTGKAYVYKTVMRTELSRFDEAIDEMSREGWEPVGFSVDGNYFALMRKEKHN